MKVSADQLIFSVKLFVAGMIAFAIAVRIGLPILTGHLSPAASA